MNKSQQNTFGTLSEAYEGACEEIDRVVLEIQELGAEAAEIDSPTTEMVDTYGTLRDEYREMLPGVLHSAKALADFGGELGGVYTGRSDRWQESEAGVELIQFAEELEGISVETYDLPEEFDATEARTFCIECGEVPASPI